jgi:hypothetical protein
MNEETIKNNSDFSYLSLLFKTYFIEVAGIFLWSGKAVCSSESESSAYINRDVPHLRYLILNSITPGPGLVHCITIVGILL